MANRYKRSFDLSVEKINKLMSLFIDDVREYAKTLDIDVNNTDYYKNLMCFIDPDIEESQSYNNTNEQDDIKNNDLLHEELITRGIADITGIMFKEYDLNLILPMILNNIYLGLGCRRVVFLLRDKLKNIMQARFGSGENVNELISSFQFQCSNADDVFNDVVNKCEDIVLLNTHEKDVSERIPGWCHKLTTPDDMILLPTTINGNCIGLIYIDNVKTRLPAEFMTYLDTLRNQLSMAIRQKLTH